MKILLGLIIVLLGMLLSGIGFTTTSDYKTYMFIGGLLIHFIGVLLIIQTIRRRNQNKKGN